LRQKVSVYYFLPDLVLGFYLLFVRFSQLKIFVQIFIFCLEQINRILTFLEYLLCQPTKIFESFKNIL
ncbi:MAG: hypothetical protein ACKO96_36015, partial [Flammeovirgaceae bacterium]